VVGRRERLDRLHTDVLEMGALAAYRIDEYPKAGVLAEQALQRDALRERSWRLLMRVASALGDRDRVTSVYRGCVEALADIGAVPEAGTTALARQLRGEPAQHAR
jgi:two-component SAPR family response regulator